MRYCATLVVLIAVASIFSESSVGADDWNYGKVAGEIAQAVKAGKLTKEEAAAKLAALKKAAKGKKKTSDHAAIEAALKAGKLTKEEAAAKLATLKKASDKKGKKSSPIEKANRQRKKQGFPLPAKHTEKHEKTDQAEYQSACADVDRVFHPKQPHKTASHKADDQHGFYGLSPAVKKGHRQQHKKGTCVCNEVCKASVQKRHE